MNTGGFPGRRAVTRIRAAAASPFGLSEPASGSEWPVVPGAGRLPAKHRDDCDSGTGLRLSAPTSASADHAACGSSVDGGTIPPRHESLTKFSVSTILATTGPKADFGACHYPVRTNPHPQRGPGSDRRQPRQARSRAVPTRADTRQTTPPRRSWPSPTIRTRPALSPPCLSLPDVLARQGRTAPTPARPTAPLTRCARPTDGTVRRESSATHRRTTWTRRLSREPSSGASTSAPASAPSRTKFPPRPASSSSGAWTKSTKCSDGSKTASEHAGDMVWWSARMFTVRWPRPARHPDGASSRRSPAPRRRLSKFRTAPSPTLRAAPGTIGRARGVCRRRSLLRPAAP